MMQGSCLCLCLAGGKQSWFHFDQDRQGTFQVDNNRYQVVEEVRY